MIRNHLEIILDKTPKLVVLELESNDLCDPHCDGQTIGLALGAFVHLLHTELHVKFTTVCKQFTGQGHRFHVTSTYLWDWHSP